MKTIGFIGIGNMGKGMVLRLKSRGYKVVGHNRSSEPLYDLAEEKIEVAFSVEELCSKLGKNKLIWLMLPKDSVEIVLQKLKPLLAKDDTIIDGGDSNYDDSERRAKEFELVGVNFLDAGVIGSPETVIEGVTLVVGGRSEVFEKHEGVFSALAIKDSYAYVGKSGAGHFVKKHYLDSHSKIEKIIEKRNETLRRSPYNIDIDEIMNLTI